MAFNITGQMKIKTLCEKFKEEFGLTLRVYDGRSFADPSKTVGSVRKKEASGELSVRKSMLVGNLEDKFQELFGIKTQIAGSDDSYLCDNGLSLAKAFEKDAKKIIRRDKKSIAENAVENNSEEGSVAMSSDGNSAGFFPIGEELSAFVNKLIQGSNLESVSDGSDVFDVSEMLRNEVSAIDGALSDDSAEELTEAAKELTEYIELIDFWKVVSIFTPLEEDVYRIEFPINENIRSKFTNMVDASLDALNIAKDELDEIGLSDESSEEDIRDAIDLLFACFYLGVEMSIGYVDDEGDWCSVGDEDALKQWVTGFGNPYDYDNPVSDVLSEVFDNCPDMRDDFYEKFFLLLKSIYNIDVDDHRDDESVDWDAVSQELEGLM